MSMSKTVAIFFCLFVISSLGTAEAVSIRVVPGGIPIAIPDKMLEEGIRQGNAALLRRAWSEYEKAGALEGPTMDSYLKMGRVFFHLSLLEAATDLDATKAHRVAKDASALQPETADAHHLMGIVLSGRGRYLDAMEELRLALELNPTNELILCDMAALHLALHESGETIALLEGKVLRKSWTYFVLALAWLQQGEKGKALFNLMKARHLGMSGYWLDMALSSLGKDLSLPLGR